MHHPKADVDRVHLPRKEGGRDLTQLEMSLKTTTIGLHEYLRTSNDLVSNMKGARNDTPFPNNPLNISLNLI